MLGVRPATVASMVRGLADSTPVEPGDQPLVGCWVSPGWAARLTVDGDPGWPGMQTEAGEGEDPAQESGLVGVLVAREGRLDKVMVCGVLVDVFCQGVRGVLRPRAVGRRDLDQVVREFFSAYPSEAVAAPVELAQQLVHGSVEYAKGLGLEPGAGYDVAAAFLGPSEGECPIHFGRDGRPYYVQGQDDDASAVLEALEKAVGKDGFDFVAAAGPAPSRRSQQQTQHAWAGGRQGRRSG